MGVTTLQFVTLPEVPCSSSFRRRRIQFVDEFQFRISCPYGATTITLYNFNYGYKSLNLVNYIVNSCKIYEKIL